MLQHIEKNLVDNLSLYYIRTVPAKLATVALVFIN